MRMPIISLLVAVSALTGAGMAVQPVSAAAAPKATTQATDQPQGAYWHVRSVSTGTHPRQVGRGSNRYWLEERVVLETWTDHTGRMHQANRRLGARPKSATDRAAWKRDGSPRQWRYRTEGMLVERSMTPDEGQVIAMKGRAGFLFGGDTWLTYDQLQNLPARPSALRQWLTKASTVGPDPVDAKDLTTWLKSAYIELLYQMPVPKEVRQAAYQGLLTLPGVRTAAAGEVTVSYPFSATSWMTRKLTIDRSTMLLRTLGTKTVDNSKPLLAKSASSTFEAGWTDTEPAVPSADTP